MSSKLCHYRKTLPCYFVKAVASNLCIGRLASGTETRRYNNFVKSIRLRRIKAVVYQRHFRADGRQRSFTSLNQCRRAEALRHPIPSNTVRRDAPYKSTIRDRCKSSLIINLRVAAGFSLRYTHPKGCGYIYTFNFWYFCGGLYTIISSKPRSL